MKRARLIREKGNKVDLVAKRKEEKMITSSSGSRTLRSSLCALCALLCERERERGDLDMTNSISVLPDMSGERRKMRWFTFLFLRKRRREVEKNLIHFFSSSLFLQLQGVL